MIIRSTALVLALNTSFAVANEYTDQLEELAHSTLSSWVSYGDLIATIREQNESHKHLSDENILALDNEWRRQVGTSDTPMVSQILGRELSDFLREQKYASDGLVTEVFVMDNRGLNVGQSDVTTDFWQGDEPKWKQSFGAGAGAMHIGQVELDENTKRYQSQISMAISDPETGEPIGAITFGIDLEYLD